MFGGAGVFTQRVSKDQERQGAPARWGTRLVVFLRPNRLQFEKATSRDALSSRDPLPFAPSQRGAEGGVPARRGIGVPARGILRPIRGQEAWEFREPGPPTSRDPSHVPSKEAQGKKTTSPWHKYPLWSFKKCVYTS